MLKKTAYYNEMLALVDKAIDELKKIEFDTYTVSIWTDFNACLSAFSIDSEGNSINRVAILNKFYEEFNKPRYLGRNYSPADFELRNFILITNQSFEENWEENSKGKCWEEVEPILKEIGEYAFDKIKQLPIHKDFELGVNGRSDWYEFSWKL